MIEEYVFNDGSTDGTNEVKTPKKMGRPKLSSRDVINPKSFSCPICGETYKQECHLNVHILSVHVGIKAHKCDICGASFPHLRNLKVHITAVHEGNKPHKCEICGSRFAEKGKLTRHA